MGLQALRADGTFSRMTDQEVKALTGLIAPSRKKVIAPVYTQVAITSRDKQKASVYCEMVNSLRKLATCTRLKAACLIVSSEGGIIGAGINGSPRGLQHCTEVGCRVIDNHCTRTIHAEINGITFAGGAQGCKDATMYVSHNPCIACAQVIMQAGILRVIYDGTYNTSTLNQVREDFEQADIEFYSLNEFLVL